MQSGDAQLRQLAQEFLELCHIEWSDGTSSAALRTPSQWQWNKPKGLALAEDIAKLTAYLHEKVQAARLKLSTPNCNPGDWRALARLTLVQVMLFNRRRSGEVERIPQTAYENRSTTVDKDVVSSLSSWEQHLCKSSVRFEVRGKIGRKVPTLLTREMHSSVDLLIESRDKANVSNKNCYVFANPMSSGLHPLRGSASLCYIVKQCGIDNPDTVTPHVYESTLLPCCRYYV